MRRYSIIILLIFAFTAAIYINYDVSKIQSAKASYMQVRQYKPVINVTGEFEYADKTDVILSFPLYIKEVYVKENSYVNKGQALFSIDKAKMASVLSDGPSEEFLSDLDISELNSFKAPMESFNIDDIINIPDVIYSPENGIVTALNIFPGGISLPDQSLLTVGHSDDILAKFSLSQTDYGKVNIGDTVEIKPVAFNNKKYNGIITDSNAIIKKLNSISGTKTVVEVFATVDDADYLVSDGLQINGVVHCGADRLIKALDYDYIYQDGTEQFVYVLEKGMAVRKNIETGIETDNYTQILTEFANNTVFLSGKISDGDRVLITE